MVAALGIAAANFIWLALAASGAAALAITFPSLFIWLKLIGLALIFWLGIGVMRQDPHAMLEGLDQAPPRKKLFAKGLGLQLSNPLALVTFVGILPTFFALDRPMMPQYLMMIGTLTYLELQGLAVYAGFGRAIRAKLSDPRFARLFNIVIGSIMIAAGTAAIVFTSHDQLIPKL